MEIFETLNPNAIKIVFKHSLENGINITDVPAIIERGLVFIFWKLFTIQS